MEMLADSHEPTHTIRDYISVRGFGSVAPPSFHRHRPAPGFLFGMMRLVGEHPDLGAAGAFPFLAADFSISARCAAMKPFFFSSILSSSRRRAMKRLSPCWRVSWHLTCTPVGRCSSITQVETLLTFCPPWPPERTKFPRCRLAHAQRGHALCELIFLFRTDGECAHGTTVAAICDRRQPL